MSDIYDVNKLHVIMCTEQNMISSWNGSRSSVTSEPLMRSVDCVDECHKLQLVWCDERLEKMHYMLQDV